MAIDPVTSGGAVPSRAQAVIVGGGVIGCSIAYHLAHLGWTDVLLLEQHKLTAGTTWHAAGLITSAGMTDETSLFFSRYSRDLYARLEEETGHSTGFRAVGHISLATTPQRREALRREAAWMHGFGVEDVEISPRELAELWPLARTDDVLSAFYVADEGRADPVGVATSLAKGASQLGVRVVEGVAATGVQASDRRVCAVLTEAERTVEQLGVLFGDAVWPTWKPSTGRNVRRSVLHERLAAAGGQFGVSAGWEFTEWFAGPGEVPVATLDYRRQDSHAIVGREHAAVREAVGVLDMSLMAKLVVQGPDAAAVLSRLSANDVTLGPGRLVYTQWLNQAGGIIADVTVTCLETAKFLVVASDIIHRRIEPLIRRAARPGEVVTVTDVTSGTTLLSVQGPAARELIGRLTDDDLSNEAFAYLAARQIHVGYAPVLAIRVTYVGELGWELHVPAEYALGVYDDLMAVGGDLGCRPIGLQAMSGLRLEKGYRDMGVDIDSTDNPLEAGLGFAVAWDKPGGFNGRDALLRARAEGPPRNRVVSLLVDDPAIDLFGNEPVLADGKWAGYIRAAAYGYTVGGPVGLAQVASADGVTSQWLKSGDFRVRTPAGDIPARLQIAPFYDPQRLRILDR